MPSPLRLLALLAIGTLVGTGYGYLQGLSQPKRFRSTADLRITVPPAPENGTSPPAGQLGRMPELLRSETTVREALILGGLENNSPEIELALLDFRAGKNFAVETVGFSLTEILIRATKDDLDPQRPQAFLQNLLKAFQQQHFPETKNDEPTDLETTKQKLSEMDQRLAVLEQAEKEYREWRREFDKLTADGRSVDDLKRELTAIEVERAEIATRIQGFQKRLTNAAEAKEKGQPAVKLLSLLRGETGDAISPQLAALDQEQVLTQIRRLITSLREEIATETTKLEQLDMQIATLRETTIRRQQESVKEQEYKQKLESLQADYDAAVKALGLSKEPEKREEVKRQNGELFVLKAPSAGVPYGLPFEQQLLRGTAYGAGAGAVVAALVATASSFRSRPKVRRWP